MNQTISERRIRNNRIKRRQQLQRYISLSALTIILALIFSLLFFNIQAKAQDSPENISYKCFKSITVHTNDTLWNYAELYADAEHYESKEQYINEVIRINTLDNEEIAAGNYIIIPYYSLESE